MLLDFEKPIAALENKLDDMKHLAQDSDKEVQAAIKALEKKIKDLKKERRSCCTKSTRSNSMLSRII